MAHPSSAPPRRHRRRFKIPILLLCAGIVLTGAAWGFSYYGLLFYKRTPTAHVKLALVNGIFEFEQLTTPSRGISGQVTDWGTARVQTYWRKWWVWYPKAQFSGGRIWIQCPLYIPALACLLLIACLLIISKLARHRAAEGGLCHDCGYDLRGSDTRCPECGAPILVASNP